jgi:hypothetical protein
MQEIADWLEKLGMAVYAERAAPIHEITAAAGWQRISVCCQRNRE